MPKRRHPAMGLAACAIFLLFAGCGSVGRIRNFFHDDEAGDAAVRVGGKVYTKAHLERFFDSRLSEFQDPATADKTKSNLLDSFIEEKLLLTQAERLKIEIEAQALQEMLQKIAESAAEKPGERTEQGRDTELERNLTESLKIQRYLHDHLVKDVTVTNEECEGYYKAHLPDYIRNDVVHVHEILVDDRGRAQKIQAMLAAKRNRNFAELARIYSKAPSAADGGDMGSFQRGELPEEFEKIIFSLTPGKASRIVRTNYGYHIFLVTEKILAHQQRFWEVKDAIREKLLLERKREIIDKELASLASQVPVEIDTERLGFNYIGTRFPSR